MVPLKPYILDDEIVLKGKGFGDSLHHMAFFAAGCYLKFGDMDRIRQLLYRNVIKCQIPSGELIRSPDVKGKYTWFTASRDQILPIMGALALYDPNVVHAHFRALFERMWASCPVPFGRDLVVLHHRHYLYRMAREQMGWKTHLYEILWALFDLWTVTKTFLKTIKIGPGKSPNSQYIKSVFRVETLSVASPHFMHRVQKWILNKMVNRNKAFKYYFTKWNQPFDFWVLWTDRDISYLEFFND